MATAAQQQAFLASYQSYAQTAQAQTGVPWQTILAQWADETGYGTSQAFTAGNNFAGVSPGGNVASYPSQAAGLDAYIQTLLQPTYAAVRNASGGGPVAAAQALGASPWAGSHYDDSGGGPGSDLVAILNQTGLDAGSDQNAVLTSDNPLGTLGQAVLGGIPGGALIEPEIQGVAGAGNSEVSSIASGVVSDLVSAVQKPALTGVFLLLAAGLVGGGLYVALKPNLPDVKDTVHKVADVAAVAAA